MIVTFEGEPFDLADRDQRIEFGMKRWAPMMSSLANKLSNPVCGKEDLIQEANLKILNAADHWDPDREGAASFETYVFKCIRNAMIEAAQRSRFAMSIPSGSMVNAEEDNLVTGRLNSDVPDERGDPRDFMEIVDTIEEFDHYRIGEMYFVERRTLQEISELTGVPRSTVQRTVIKMKEILKNRLTV